MNEPAPNTETAASADERPARPGDLLRDARVAWAVAALALVAAALMGVQWQALRAEAAARAEAREAAEVIAARVTTFEGATIEDFVSEVADLATGDYAEQVAELFDAEFRAALREGEVESVGQVLRSFVQRMEDGEAEVFVLVRQTSINAALEEPVEDELRMELTVVREDGRWLASDIAVLGPAAEGLAPPAAPADEAPASGEDGTS